MTSTARRQAPWRQAAWRQAPWPRMRFTSTRERLSRIGDRLAVSGQSVPRTLRERLAFERGERVLAVACDPAGHRALIATDRALCYRADEGDWQRLGWARVAGVSWGSTGWASTGRASADGVAGGGGPGRYDPAGWLVVTSLPEDGRAGDGPRRAVVPLGARGEIPQLAAERITHTRLGRWPVPIGNGRKALIEVRRPAGPGGFLWVITMDGDGPGLDDHAVRAQVEGAIARLRAAAGVHRAGGTLPSLKALASRLPDGDAGSPEVYVPRPRTGAGVPRIPVAGTRVPDPAPEPDPIPGVTLRRRAR